MYIERDNVLLSIFQLCLSIAQY